MIKKSIIKAFLDGGFTNKDITEILDVSDRYVREVNKEQNPPVLNMKNYIYALHSGVTAKQDLAKHFRVSRMTINRFERINNTAETLGRLPYFDAHLECAKNELNEALNILESIAKYDSSITSKYYMLKQVLDALLKC